MRQRAAILAADDVKRDGDVVVPGYSALFSRGPDGVALATFKHNQEVQRQERQASALHFRQMQQQQSEAKAVEALKMRKRLGGTLARPAAFAAPASRGAQPQQQSGAMKGTSSTVQQEYMGGMSAADAEKLMKTKSNHAAEARSVRIYHSISLSRFSFLPCSHMYTDIPIILTHSSHTTTGAHRPITGRL